MKGIKEAISLLRRHSDDVVRCVCHLDADGIVSAGILAKALIREGIRFQLSTTKQITPEIIEKIRKDDPDLVIFTDLGSGQVDLLNSLETDLLVLDHHPPAQKAPNFVEINAFKLGLDGDKEISGAGITYLFVRGLCKKNKDLVHLALIGASGDFQEIEQGKNKELLKEAIKLGSIREEKGLKLYGRNTRPIHRALELCTDPFIPGVSNSESGAVQFLSDLGIKIKKDREWRTIADLRKEERKKLVSALLAKTLGEYRTEDLIGKIFLLQMGLDVRELATLINSCGRTGNSDLGISICLGDPKALEEAEQVAELYKQKIGKALDWVYDNLDQEDKILRKKATYVLAGSEIDPKIIGTVVNICLRSKILNEPLIGLAYDRKKVKLSGRVRKKDIDIGDVLRKASEAVGGSGGGHRLAAGGYLSKGKEKRFIEEVEKQLK